MNTDNYQTTFPVDGLKNEKQEANSESLEKFIDKLAEYNFTEITLGFATECDECRLRHIHASIKIDNSIQDGLCPNCREWPSEFEIDENELYEILSCVEVERLNTIHVGRREIISGGYLYISEPRLVDGDGAELLWNYSG